MSEGSASVFVVFEDLASNSGQNVSATTDASVVTIDLTAPTLTSVVIASDNAADSTKANGGDTITVSMVASEALVAPTVTIAGQAATVSGSGTSWTASYAVVAASVSEGACSVAITFADLASNAGAAVASTTDSSSVEIDKTPPSLTSVSITSNNAMDATRANVGDTITLTILASEAIVLTTKDIRISGEYATPSGSGGNWSAAYVVAANEVNEGLAWILED